MKRVTIVRLDRDGSTPGLVYIDTKFFCFSLELPWKENARNVSCIPLGNYKVKWDASVMKYRVLNVLNRTDIEVHKGNKLKDTTGCILVGTYLFLDEDSMLTEPDFEIEVESSQAAFDGLRGQVGDNFNLSIQGFSIVVANLQ